MDIQNPIIHINDSVMDIHDCSPVIQLLYMHNWIINVDWISIIEL